MATTKLAKSGLSVWVALVTAVIGLVVYLVTSFTGYLAGSATNPAPIVCTVIAIVLAVVLAAAGDKLGRGVLDLAVLATTALLIASFALFALGRVSLVADVYFIPVNYPAAEETALNISIVGLVSYLVSIVAMIAACFSGKLSRD